MSRIDDLIQELCPDGVERKPLGELATLVRGNGMPKTDLDENGVGAIHYGQIYTRYGVWATETLSFVTPEKATKLAKADPGDIIITNTSENIDDVGKAVAWLGDATIVTGGHATVIKHDQEPKYLAYWFASADFYVQKRKLATGTKVVDVSAKQMATVRIPVPPPEVQREIVRVLDKFTQLEAELEAELEARRAQYEHYRAQLLDEAGTGAASVQLGDLGRIVTGRTPKSSDASAWGVEVDFVTPSDIRNGMKTVTAPGRRLSDAGAASMAKVVIPAGSLLVTCIGADMGKTVINANDCVTNQQINSIIPTKDVVVEYFFHLLTAMRDRLRAQGERAGGTMPLINKTDFSKIEVPVPSLEVQKQVASKLDNFDALVNDISIGLPAELAARRKQYEHYRDRLLTFKELAS
ncbi:restriction endonuclease subunit S [Brachybacterium tyrofermentans]|uniref:restriction endonuclease subunit S n=1 Tax=Brachybacterium tyrofermentans TaxID=47848 RepID=UPI003FD30CC0